MDISKYIKNTERCFGKISSFLNKHRFQGKTLKPRLHNKSFLYAFFLFLIFMSFVLKYPVTGYGGGIDSHFYHQLCNIIIERGAIPWAKSPLSFFDLYPISANTGMPMVATSMAQMASSDLIEVLLPFSYIQTIVAVLGSFMASYEFKRDVYFAAFTSAVFSVTTRYIFYTNFLFGARGFFLTFLPFFFWALFRYNRERSHKYRLLVIVFAVISLSIHSMGILIILVVFSFMVGPDIHGKIVIYLMCHKKGTYIVSLFTILATVVFLLVSYFYGFAKLGSYLTDTPERFMLGTDPLSYLISLGYNYGKWVGAFLPLAMIGFILLVFKSERTWLETSLLFSFIIFLPLFGGFMYIAPFLFFMFSLLIGYTLYYYRTIFNGKKQIVFVIVVFVLIILSATILNTLVYKIGDGEVHSYWMEERNFSAGMYMRYNGKGYYAHGDWYNTRQVGVVAQVPYGITFDRGYAHVDKFDFDTVKLKSLNSWMQTPDRPFTIESWYWQEANYYSGMARDRIFFQHLEDEELQDWIARTDLRYMIRDEESQRRLERQSIESILQNPSIYNMPEFYRYKIYRNDDLAVYHL